MAAAMNKALCVALIAAVIMAAASRPAEAALGCGQVISFVSPCLPYVTNGPLGRCCNGVRALNNAAQTTPDRQSACRCLKTLARGYNGINLGKAAGLPKTCRVNIPYKISPNTDCSRVK